MVDCESGPSLGRFHPEAAPLSILFGHFLSWERKCLAEGRPGEGGVVTLALGAWPGR